MKTKLALLASSILLIGGIAQAETLALMTIDSVSVGIPMNGKVDVVVQFERECNERYLGILQNDFATTAPVREVALRVVAEVDSAPCTAATVPITETIEVDIASGIPHYIPVQP